jgi:hypothetical protein
VYLLSPQSEKALTRRRSFVKSRLIKEIGAELFGLVVIHICTTKTNKHGVQWFSVSVHRISPTFGLAGRQAKADNPRVCVLELAVKEISSPSLLLLSPIKAFERFHRKASLPDCSDSTGRGDRAGRSWRLCRAPCPWA